MKREVNKSLEVLAIGLQILAYFVILASVIFIII